MENINASRNEPTRIPDVTRRYRTVFRGTLITNNGYDRHSGNAVLERREAELVAYGRPFIANPDLPERFGTCGALAEGDPATFYQGGARGYVDYPPLRSQAA